jgi:hydroxymethylpyrimidine pyrophosphatase-like HAD family hydrolase
MGMTLFAKKLRRLTETIALVGDRGAADIGGAMAEGRKRLAIAIGAGPSAIAAEFFARCRTTLGLGATLVMTPLQFVLSMEDWDGAEIWLFSGGADDPDLAAALTCAASSRADAVRLMTTNSDDTAAIAAAAGPGIERFVLPVADRNDDFLATHSMTAMIVGLLIASDGRTECPQGRGLLDALQRRAGLALDDDVEELVGGFRRGDTVIAVCDPQVTAVGVLLETLLWETGIAPVHRTDFRYFVHGRRVWAARHPDTTFTLALTTRESETLWQPINATIPAYVRRAALSLGHGGRLANAVGVVRGLAVIARLGEIVDIDPGRPRATAAEAGDDAGLLGLAEGLRPAVRHKAAAKQLHDPPDDAGVSLCVSGQERLRDLGAASFIGIVLDYDGTVVPNEPAEARLGPPSPQVMAELVRLVDCGTRVGFATGRGGSAGEKLRGALPDRIHRRIPVGYYNGAYVRTLDVDIRHDRPESDPHLAAVAEWIGRSGLLRESAFLASEVQVTVKHESVQDVAAFRNRLASCPEIAAGKVKVLSSQHSFDIVPSGTTKLAVVRELSGGGCTGRVLGIGDSGSPLGNDRELLSAPHAVSVGSVCGSHAGAWTLFGSKLCGPDAVLRILRAARVEDGELRIDVSKLGLP